MNQYLEVRIKRKKGDKEMQELAKRFIGKDVYINTVVSGAVDGILKEVVDNAYFSTNPICIKFRILFDISILSTNILLL